MNLRYLLDTSVYSQPLRRKPVMSALSRWSEVGDRACAVSVVSIAEVEFGLHLEARPERMARYRSILEGRLTTIETDAMIWGEFVRRKARQHQTGRPVSDLDMLIATCAIHHNFVVATLNASDFSRIEGVAWEDWSV